MVAVYLLLAFVMCWGIWQAIKESNETRYEFKTTNYSNMYSRFSRVREDKTIPAPERYKEYVVNVDEHWTDEQLIIGESYGRHEDEPGNAREAMS